MEKTKDTKRKQIEDMVRAGNWASALRMAKSFWFGFSKEEASIIGIAHECFNSKKENFYKSINVDTEEVKAKAIDILKIKFAND